MIKSLFPNKLKVIFTIDGIRLGSSLTTNQTKGFSKKFYNTILGFTQFYSVSLCDILGIIQLIPGTYKSNRHFNITGIDKIHLKSDCMIGSIVNGIHEPFLYSTDPTSLPGQKIYKELGINLLRKTKKSVLSHITIFLEDDDHKPVDFIGKTV